ncbi:MAG: hypothetical protein ACREA0_20950, partial [bacterium]
MPRLDQRERPTLPSSVKELVTKARTRLLLTGMVRLAVTLLGVSAALATILVAVGRFVVMPWAEPAALLLLIGSVVVALVAALIRRASPARAALAVDRRLGGFD